LSAANGYDQSYAAACRLEIAHFFEILQSGGVFKTTIADGLAAQKLADAATSSYKSGLPVTF
jgi:myo-inositol 2-dehydrogenase / D-chiro-inositol 1-dehydrogenase